MTNYNANWLSRDELVALPFAALGTNVLIDTSVRLIGIENIWLGNNVRIDAGTIIVASGPVKIGSRVHVAAFCYLEGRGGIRLGDFANISSYVSIHSVSDDPSGSSLTNPMTPDRYKNLYQSEVVVERHSIVFAKATLLPGTRMGEGAVLGAHSLAKGALAAWTIWVGSPAVPVKERSRDLLDLERKLILEDGL
jgi:acetyltransferase-like isoleucine patch superfamily enzyme